MIRDEDVDWKLEAYLDAELPPDESARMALLLEEDPDLGARFAHLQRTRDAGRAYFQSIMAGAPEVPSALQSAPQALALRPRVWRWAGVVAGAAAVLVAAVVVFSPSKQTHASPTVVLERALGRFGAFDSVELWGRLEMPGIAALMQAFNSDPESSKSRSTTKTVRVLLDGQNRMLVQSSADVDEPFSAAHALVGSDGQTSWSWNPEEGEVEISPNSIFGLEVEGGLELDRPLIDYLRWGLFERLHSQSGDVDLREVTWPADRRAGRRVFEME
ncbi:MAG: hypothetical protein KDB18_14000, partial [Salinibacterium sp.]|nr:hypothetical protein [Salinibacterium sp.]